MRHVPHRTGVAVLGTGRMGSAIAARLADVGYQVTLWNRTRERAEAIGIGTVAGTPAAASSQADVVISSLTGPEAVRATYLGPDGALADADGRLYIEMSTAGPGIMFELAAAVGGTDARLVDAPILGSPPVVRTGQVAVLVGGASADVERARPILEQIGEVRYAGPLGSGARLKLIANSLLGDVTVAAAELQAAGEAAGLDPDDVFWVLKRRVPSLEARRAGYLEDRHEPPSFAMRDMRKDLDLAMALFDELGVEAPVTASSAEVVRESAETTPDLEITAVIRRFRARR